MARDWRRVVVAASAGALLAAACTIGVHAQAPAEEEPEAQEETPEASPDAPPKSTAKKKQDPVEAQRTIDAALKQLNAGKAEQAVQSLSATLAAGNLPPAVLAKALYVRGMAYRAQKRPAQALSDLTGALWLKGGLGGDERVGAIKERAAAYADAGLTVSGEPTGPNAPEKRTKTASGSWLGNLFGGSSDSPAPPPPPPPAKRPETEKASVAPVAKAPSAAPGAWSSKTQVVTGGPPPTEPPPAPKAVIAPAPKAEPPPAPTPVQAEGKYLVQLAAVRTEAEAQALAAKAKREHAAILSARQQLIDRAVFGNMGAFYRVRFGPFATAQETQAVCARLQGGGFDCMPVSP